MTDDEQDKKNVLSNFKDSVSKDVPPKKKRDKDFSVDVGLLDSKLVKEPLHPEPSSVVATEIAETEENMKRAEEFKTATTGGNPLSQEMKKNIDIQSASQALTDDVKIQNERLGYNQMSADSKRLASILGVGKSQNVLSDLQKLDRDLKEISYFTKPHEVYPPTYTAPIEAVTQPPRQEVVEEPKNNENIVKNYESVDDKPDHRFMSDEDVLEYAKDYKIKCNSGKQETPKIPPKADSRYSDYFMLKSLEESKLIHLTMEPITTGEHSGKVEVTELRLTIAGGEKLEAYLARTPLRRVLQSAWDNIGKIIIGVTVAVILLIIKTYFFDNNSDSSISASPAQQSESVSSQAQETSPPTQ